MNKLEDSIEKNLYSDVQNMDDLHKNYNSILKAFVEIFPENDVMEVAGEANTSIEITQKVSEFSNYIKCLLDDKHIEPEIITQTIEKIEDKLSKKFILDAFLDNIDNTNENAYKILQIQEFVKGSSMLYIFSEVDKKVYIYDFLNPENTTEQDVEDLSQLINQKNTQIWLHRNISKDIIMEFLDSFNTAFDNNHTFWRKLHAFMIAPEKYWLKMYNKAGAEYEIISLEYLDWFKDDINVFLESEIIDVQLIDKPQPKISKIIWEL